MDFEKVKQYMDGCLEAGLPCYNLYIQRDHEILYHISNGFSDAEHTKPIKGNETYWIFSATKPITVTVAMTLVEKGLLSLDDDVSKYIPEYANLTVAQADGSIRPAKTVMKIHHLFSMSSGLTYDFGNPLVCENRTPNSTTLEVVREFPKMPLTFDPGEKWQYGLSHDVLAAVVEVVTGKSFSQYVDEVIFKPLGMTNSTFHPTAEQYARMAQKYGRDNEGNITKEDGNYYRVVENYESGGAGLCSTVEDYIKFADAMACGESADGYRILSEKSVNLLRKNRFTDEQLKDYWKNDESGYGLGVYTLMKSNKSGVPAETFGWDGAAGAFLSIDPDNHISVFNITHLHNWGACVHYETMRDLAYECIFDK